MTSQSAMIFFSPEGEVTPEMTSAPALGPAHTIVIIAVEFSA